MSHRRAVERGFKWERLVVMFCSYLPVKRCEGDRAWLSQLLLLFLMHGKTRLFHVSCDLFLFVQTWIYAKALAFSHIAMDASSTQSVNILETFNEYQYRISAPTISTSFNFGDLVKERLMCIVLCPNIVQITICFFVTIPCHTSPSMRHHAWSWCIHYQQNVP